MAPEQRAVEVGWRVLMCSSRWRRDSVSSSSPSTFPNSSPFAATAGDSAAW